MGVKRRSEDGFTFVEVLIALAILITLMSLIFVGVINRQKSLRQLELDETAREIFVVAQNHLTMSQTEESINSLSSTKKGTSLSGSEYYFTVTPEDARLGTGADNVLYRMLPRFSIDEQVRTLGNYVIRYDAATATVLEVFYIDWTQANSYNKSNGAYPIATDDDGADLLDNYSGSDKKDDRNDYKGLQVGWCDGSNVERWDKSEQLWRPTVTVNNGDTLTVTVDVSGTDVVSTDSVTYYTLTKEPSKTRIRLFIEGESSDHKTVMVDGLVSEIFESASTKTWTLDDITSNADHFSQLFGLESSLPTDEQLYAGENIAVYAEAYRTDVVANIATSERVRTNSLFASTYMDSGEAIGRIATIRHLENIDPSISGYLSGKPTDDDYVDAYQKFVDDVAPRKFKQTKNLSWASFVGSDDATITIYDVTRVAAATENTFVPIKPYLEQGTNTHTYTTEYLEEYDGSGLYIKGIVIGTSDEPIKSEAGLFATIEGTESDPVTVKNLELINLKVNAEDADAGSLIGYAEYVDIEEVLVRHETPMGDEKVGFVNTSGTDASAAGGLIGEMSGGSVSLSSASVFVYSEDGAAGGLIGEISGSAAVSVEHSYAGGHTQDGEYAALSSVPDGVDSDNKSYNVVAGTVAGGLIGDASSMTGSLAVQYCYSTASASGATAGGLIGSVASGTIKDSYAMGLVHGVGDSAKVGLFTGVENGTTHDGDDNNLYFEIIDEDAQVTSASSSIDGLSALDASVTTYEAFVTIGKNSAAAEPYDDELETIYQGTYPYKTVLQLGSVSGSTYFSENHYGDWPSPEVLVINE